MKRRRGAATIEDSGDLQPSPLKLLQVVIASVVIVPLPSGACWVVVAPCSQGGCVAGET